MKVKVFIIYVLLFVGYAHCMAQNIALPNPMNENLLKGRVKQIDEFMCRFNMTETWEGTPITDRSDTAYRKKYLATLFDQSKFRTAEGRLTKDASEFTLYVTSHDYQLHYEDSTWTAELRCSARIGAKTEKIKLFLNTYKIKDSEYKWVVNNVSGKIFNMEKSNGHTSSFISPMEHEIGFVGLLTLKTGSINISDYMGRNYMADKMSMLAVLLQNNLLKIETIDSVLFHFYTIPDYAFTVERIERKGSFNTGWLITKLNKLN